MSGPPEIGQLQAAIRRAHARYQRGVQQSFQIPGFVFQFDVGEGETTGALWCTFRAITDYGDALKIADAAPGADPTEQDLEQAVDLLLTTCVGSEIRIDGADEPINLEMPLGAGLADWLGCIPEGVTVTDRQGVFLIFNDHTLDLASVAGRVGEMVANAGLKADARVEGNSPAAN